MKLQEKIARLRGASFFAGLDEATLADVAEQATLRRYGANHRIVTELEFGDEVYVIARGRAQISVSPQRSACMVIGEIGPGAAFGEMSSLTGELRSATVRTLTPVDVLVLSDELFDRLTVCRPEIAVSLVHTLTGRLVEAERTVATLLTDGVAASVDEDARASRSSLSVLWRELVLNHEKDLAFLALVVFAATLIVIRLIVFLAFKYSIMPREVLRAAYVSGFVLVMLSACAAILTYRPKWRRIITSVFSLGAALIVNELGITLAFDIFYKDGSTLDPALTFDIEQLYRRTEPGRAAVVALALLLQAVYLESFYRRAWHLLKVRLLRLLRHH